MGKRIQSPSSINTYKQCPRKYYYQYIQKLPTKPSIHLVRGKVAHSVLEDFYDLDVSAITKDQYKTVLQRRLAEMFVKYWHDSKNELAELKMRPQELSKYFEETVIMLLNWFNSFTKRVDEHPSSSFPQIFSELKPIREEGFVSEKHQVRGFIDVIDSSDGEVTLLDYKTSKKDIVTQQYKLQLGIYSLLYYEKYGSLPSKAGLFFLKHGAKYIDVNASLIQRAITEIQYVHEKTVSDNIADYPQVITGLCKWRTGCCDFYEECFRKKVDVPVRSIRIKE